MYEQVAIQEELMSKLDLLLAAAAPETTVHDDPLVSEVDMLATVTEQRVRRLRKARKFAAGAAGAAALAAAGTTFALTTGSSTASYFGTPTEPITFPDGATCSFTFSVVQGQGYVPTTPSQSQETIAATEQILSAIDYAALSTAPAAPLTSNTVGGVQRLDTLREREIRSIQDQVWDRVSQGLAAQGLSIDNVALSNSVSCSDGDTSE